MTSAGLLKSSASEVWVSCTEVSDDQAATGPAVKVPVGAVSSPMTTACRVWVPVLPAWSTSLTRGR